MIDKALMVVQTTDLYSIAVLEWNGFDANNHIWSEFNHTLQKSVIFISNQEAKPQTYIMARQTNTTPQMMIAWA